MLPAVKNCFFLIVLIFCTENSVFVVMVLASLRECGDDTARVLNTVDLIRLNFPQW